MLIPDSERSFARLIFDPSEPQNVDSPDAAWRILQKGVWEEGKMRVVGRSGRQLAESYRGRNA